MSKLYKLSELPKVIFGKGVRGQVTVGDRLMVNFLEFEPNTVVGGPAHKHEHEQVIIVQEGSIRWSLGEPARELIVHKGEILVLESNLLHVGQVSPEGCKAIDIFVPPREDLLRLAKQ
jgi:quercetin dioxygenase-like cupin family protein